MLMSSNTLALMDELQGANQALSAAHFGVGIVDPDGSGLSPFPDAPATNHFLSMAMPLWIWETTVILKLWKTLWKIPRHIICFRTEFRAAQM